MRNPCRCAVWLILSCLSMATLARAEDLASPPATPSAAAECLPSGEPPPNDGRYKTEQELCWLAPRGIPAVGLAPPVGPLWEAAEEPYALLLRKFILDRVYTTQLGWLSDTHWRLSGPVQGCPQDKTLKNLGVHPAVRIYYSPEMIAWMCGGRVGVPPPGAMIVKEMHALDEKTLYIQPSTQNLYVRQSTVADSFTVMVKSSGGSRDQWYWAYFDYKQVGNPPIRDRSGVSLSNFPAHPTQLDPSWLPTGNPQGTVVFPYYGFGPDCINCHASAEKESTFIALESLIGREHVYHYQGRVAAFAPNAIAWDLLGPHPAVPARAVPASLRAAAPPAARPSGDFLREFPQLSALSFEQAWELRFPAETYDHVPAPPGPGAPAMFLTSDQCISCHDATVTTGKTPNMIQMREHGAPLNLSPYAEWRASPMGLAGRDPIFFAQLESELNLAVAQAGLKGKGKCIENLCLHCHGAMGKRQLALDTQLIPPDPACKGLLPDDQLRGGKLFSRKMAAAWRDEQPALAKYGGLARDGISCAVCHHISNEGFGNEATYTGNFKLTSTTELVGPYADVKVKPMEHALGITPRGAPYTQDGDLCSSCHAIRLPVFSNDGTLHGVHYEQATYLEWLNSDSHDTACQDCHMSQKHDGKPLTFKIANIEDDTFPITEGRLPDSELALAPRSTYSRHTLFGLNLFLTAFFEQFPLQLGIRQVDYMNSGPVPALVTAREAVLSEMRPLTASLAIPSIQPIPQGVAVTVTVTNKAGHNFPSGVGFRRAFIEFLVLDESGRPLWASGRTSAVGELLDGLSNTVLPSEFFLPGPQGQQLFQPHHQVIQQGNQVQIYEELIRDSEGRFTTSFLHQYQVEKDNRLRPRGWSPTGPFASETKSTGTGTDPDYVPNPKLSGTDSVRYEVTLPPNVLSQVRSIQATLYYQATPPYYLAQRFDSGRKGPSRLDIQRLYYLASNLDVDAPAEDGKPYLQGWKLPITQARVDVKPALP
ncbi:hypothetical protein KRR26_10625 [Corallococcus sp. M34]|uniref:hypothetical protein n=1 Tax=Citreicoccus inhibens TaxID=2849499 RepID=UPI001C23C1C0|nr:hypothetical protein [Citreicoccus inhibens]MBU8896062.1 hypothetical protein [Citreicoccus inhibens]